MIKTIFAEKSALRNPELIGAWKTIWTTKKIVAVYELSPLSDLGDDEEFECPMSPLIQEVLETDGGNLGSSSSEQDLYENLMHIRTEDDEPELISIPGSSDKKDLLFQLVLSYK